MRALTHILLLLMCSSGVAAQALSMSGEWELPSSAEVAGVSALSDGGVALWTGAGDITILDADLRPIATFAVERGIASVRRQSQSTLEVLMAAPPRIIRVGDGPAWSTDAIAGLEEYQVLDAAPFERDWYAIANGPSERSLVLVRLDGTRRTYSIVLSGISPDARLSVVGPNVALAETSAPMTIDVFGPSGDPKFSLSPRQSVLDSLTHGSLGVPQSEWAAGPALAFFDGGVLQPIMDRDSERTIMMIYSAEGLPVGWPVVRGAKLRVVGFNPDDGTMLGLVEHDGRRTIQKLEWRKER